MANRFIRSDWYTNRKGFRVRSEHRFATGGQVNAVPPKPGYDAIQLSAGTVIFSRATIEHYGEDWLRAIAGGDPDLKIIALEDYEAGLL